MFRQSVVGVVVECFTDDGIKRSIALYKILEVRVHKKTSCESETHLIVINELLSQRFIDRIPQGSNVACKISIIWRIFLKIYEPLTYPSWQLLYLAHLCRDNQE